MEWSSERRAMLAFLLAILILGVWTHFYKPVVPPPAKPEASAAATTPQAETSAAPTPSTVQAAPVAPAGAVQATEEKTIVVESPLYRVELTNRGGVARSWQLKKYSDDLTPPHPLDLVNAQAAKQLNGWPLSLMFGDAQLEAKANGALYRTTNDSGTLEAPAEVTFTWSDGHLEVTKRFQFTPGYVVEIEVSALLDGRPIPVAVAWRGGFGDTAVYKAAQSVNVFYHVGGKLTLMPYKKLGAPDQQQRPVLQTGPMEYTGIEDQFFAAAFMPTGPGLSLWHWKEDHNIVDDGKPATEPVAEMAAGTTTPGPLHMRAYVGPKDLTLLSHQQPSLEELVNFGWFGLIAKPLFEILKWIYRYVPNYGWAIVLLTIGINTALFYFKVQSWRSMQRMQRVAPQAESIKQRYAKYTMRDPRKKKMNEEIMELYKKEGVNPMGGCLPMLIQMPIWFALYRMLGGAIELRHAPWIGWIHDLSARDPYYILPILMTATMYFMQKMTPMTTTDPVQKKMLTLMPLMFGAIFFSYASGLLLYITTSNVIGIGQQWYLNRTEPLTNNKGRPGKKR
jgi:YidC/Oxa1 family membrane protein insertase